MLCKWNVPKFKDVSMSAVKNISWKTSRNQESVSSPHGDSSFVSYVNSLKCLDDETITKFINNIHNDYAEPVIRTIMFPNEIRRRTNCKDEVFLASIYNENNATKSHQELVEMGRRQTLLISDDEVKEIARVTRTKEKSEFWVGLRRGRITGSMFKDCCVTNIDNPSITTINRIINPPRNFGSLTGGIRNKRKVTKKTIDEYVKQALASHENFEYKEYGLIVNPAFPYFTASTDGLVSCDCHGIGCIQIKYLKILETNGAFDLLTNKPNHILNKIGDEYSLEETHEFFYKIQMMLNLSEVEYCDVIIWSQIEPLVLKINTDIDFWNTAKQKALKFHEQVIMPELLGKFYTRTGLCTRIDYVIYVVHLVTSFNS